MSSDGFLLVADDTRDQVASGSNAPVYSLFLDHTQSPPIISTSERDKQRLVDIDIIRSSLLNHVDIYDPTIYTLADKYAKLHRDLHSTLKESYRESQEASLYQLHWRDRWNVILGQPHCCKTGRYIAAFTSFLIFLTALQFALENVPILSTAFNSEMEALWITVELVVTIFFTLEIAIRIFLERDRVKWFKSVMNIADIISVVPFFILLIFGQNRAPIIKLVRLIRFFKLFRNFKQIDLLVTTLSRVGPSLLTPFLFLAICVLLIAAALYNVEGGQYLPPPADWVISERAKWGNMTNLAGQTGEQAYLVALAASKYNKFWMEDCLCTSTAAYVIGDRKCDLVPPRFNSGIHTLWFAIVTMTAVGYGDFVPTCFIGKMIAILGMLMSSVFLAMPIAIVGVSFTQSVGEMNQSDRTRKIAMTRNIAQLRRAAAAAAKQRLKKRKEHERKMQETDDRMKKLQQVQSGQNMSLEEALMSSFGPRAAEFLGKTGSGGHGGNGEIEVDAKTAAEKRLEAISRALEEDLAGNDPFFLSSSSHDSPTNVGNFRIARAEGLVRYQPKSVAEGLLMHLCQTLRVPKLDFQELCYFDSLPATRLLFTTALHHTDCYMRWILEGWLRQVCATTTPREPTIEGFNSRQGLRRGNELQAADDREVQVAQDWENCVKLLRGLRINETSGSWVPSLVLTSASLVANEELDEDFGGVPAGVSPELTISRPSIFAIVCIPTSDASSVHAGSISSVNGAGGGSGNNSNSNSSNNSRGFGASSLGGNNNGSNSNNNNNKSYNNKDGGMGQSVQKRFEHLSGIGSVPVVLNLGEVTTDIHLPQQVAYLEVRKSMLLREIRIVPLHPVFHPISVNECVVPPEGVEVKHDSIVDFSPFLGRNQSTPGDGSLRYQMKFDMPTELMLF